MSAHPQALRDSVYQAEVLWFLMQQSDDKKRRALAVTCYLDDSGSHREAPITVIGGPLFNKSMFIGLQELWPKILKRHRIEDPLHMTDFVDPGKYSTMLPEMKRALFRDVQAAINLYKVYSVSTAIPQSLFLDVFSVEFYKTFTNPVSLAHTICAMINCHMAVATNYHDPIAYLVDIGCHSKNQILTAHEVMVKRSGASMNIGSITFESDRGSAALQAADVIAWASRRILEDDGCLPEGFEPLREVLRLGASKRHFSAALSEKAIRALALLAHQWLENAGQVGSVDLSSFIKQRVDEPMV